MQKPGKTAIGTAQENVLNDEINKVTDEQAQILALRVLIRRVDETIHMLGSLTSFHSLEQCSRGELLQFRYTFSRRLLTSQGGSFQFGDCCECLAHSVYSFSED